MEAVIYKDVQKFLKLFLHFTAKVFTVPAKPTSNYLCRHNKSIMC